MRYHYYPHPPGGTHHESISGSMPVARYQVIGPWTVNNPTELDLEYARTAVLKGLARYVLFCHEVGANGTPHLQGFASAYEKKSIRAWHQIIGPRFALAPGFSGVHSIPDCIQYCKGFERKLDDEGQWDGKSYQKKEGSGEFEEYGTYEPGKRTDLLRIKRRLDDGERSDAIAKDPEHFETFMRHHKFFKAYEHMQGDLAPKRSVKNIAACREMPKIYIRYGEQDAGKSRWTDDKFGLGSAYLMPVTAPDFFGNYDGHTIVRFDEFSGYKKWKIEDSLLYFDRYPREVSVKGGYTWWKPETVVLTSNKHPSEWYPGETTHWDAFVRRIFCVKQVYKDGREVCDRTYCKHASEEEVVDSRGSSSETEVRPVRSEEEV